MQDDHIDEGSGESNRFIYMKINFFSEYQIQKHIIKNLMQNSNLNYVLILKSFIQLLNWLIISFFTFTSKYKYCNFKKHCNVQQL